VDESELQATGDTWRKLYHRLAPVTRDKADMRSGLTFASGGDRRGRHGGGRNDMADSAGAEREFERFAHPTRGRCRRRFNHCSLEKTRGLT
jgi:hypothetical protein